MATFKKPRRNFRGRKIVTEDDSNDERDADILDMEVDEQVHHGPELPKQIKKSKKSKKHDKEVKSSLSFAHDEHEDGKHNHFKSTQRKASSILNHDILCICYNTQSGL